MGKVYPAFRQKKLPSLQGAKDFAFSLSKQKELEHKQDSVAESLIFSTFNEAQNSTCKGPTPRVELLTRQQDDPPDFFPADVEDDADSGDENSKKRRRCSESHEEDRRWIKLSSRPHTVLKVEDVCAQRKNARQAVKLSQRTWDVREDDGPPLFVTAKDKLTAGLKSGEDLGWMSRSAPKKELQAGTSRDWGTGNGVERESTAQIGGGTSRGPASQKRSVRSGFVSPMQSATESGRVTHADVDGTGPGNGGAGNAMAGACRGKEQNSEDGLRKCLEMLGLDPDEGLPEKLRNLEPRVIEHTINEIMTRDTRTTWSDIAGLEHAKRCVMEMVIWPLKRPDLFRGARAPGKGLLLYGPPGTGKTMIGKAIAGESKATFFSISASSLTSKWIGEGEKLVRALFGVASCVQPAVIFIDEIDSLLSQRKEDGEHESSRRLKTQFLIEMEGCDGGSEQVLLIGATNRPQELDPALRRRMSNRLYVPLPEAVARAEIVRNLLEKDGLLTLTSEEMQAVAEETEGYSGSDMKNLVKEASMEPLREAMMSGDIDKLSNEDIRPLSIQDFRKAIKSVRPSVAPEELHVYKNWSKQFGSGEFR